MQANGTANLKFWNQAFLSEVKAPLHQKTVKGQITEKPTAMTRPPTPQHGQEEEELRLGGATEGEARPQKAGCGCGAGTDRVS